MKTQLRAGALLAASVLALSACGSGGGGTDSGALTGSGSGESCTIDSAVPLGAAISLTGAAASYGESQRNGLELGIKQANEKDGVEYSLTVEDDATDPRQSINVMEGLVDKSSLVFGPTLSNAAFQSQPIAQEAGVPVLAISNTASGITEQGDYIFRDSLTEAAVIPQTIETAKAEYGISKVVGLYSNDDDFTKSGYEVMQGALNDQGIELMSTETFSTKDTDFRSLLTKALDQDPDALVVSALIEAAIPFVTQARELGFDGPIIGGNGFNNPKLMSDAGDAAEGVIVGAAWNSASESPENDAFIQAYTDEYGKAPDQFAAQAYSAVTIVDAAVRSGCSGERDTIKEQLAAVSDLPTALGTFNFDDNRDADHPAVVQLVKDGQFTVLG